eukprot:gene8489-2876_t
MGSGCGNNRRIRHRVLIDSSPSEYVDDGCCNRARWTRFQWVIFCSIAVSLVTVVLIILAGSTDTWYYFELTVKYPNSEFKYDLQAGLFRKCAQAYATNVRGMKTLFFQGSTINGRIWTMCKCPGASIRWSSVTRAKYPSLTETGAQDQKS